MISLCQAQKLRVTGKGHASEDVEPMNLEPGHFPSAVLNPSRKAKIGKAEWKRSIA